MTLPYHPLRDSNSAVTGRSRAGLIWDSLVKYYAPEQNFTITRALDLGTGYGHVVRVGHESFGVDVFGVDIRQEIYQGPKDRFVNADLLKQWPFEDRSFDLVLEHLVFDDLVSLQKLPFEEITKHFNSELNRIVRDRGVFFSHSSGFQPDSSFSLIASDRPFCLYRKKK